MEIKARISQIRSIAKDDKEAIEMILSACADMGCEKGALLSVAKFSDAAQMILKYIDRETPNKPVEADRKKPAETQVN